MPTPSRVSRAVPNGPRVRAIAPEVPMFARPFRVLGAVLAWLAHPIVGPPGVSPAERATANRVVFRHYV